MILRPTGLVLIRMKMNVLGVFHGVPHPNRGNVVDVESQHATRYFAHGYTQPAEIKELGEPYRPWFGAA